jgi:hypothetical protein
MVNVGKAQQCCSIPKVLNVADRKHSEVEGRSCSTVYNVAYGHCFHKE